MHGATDFSTSFILWILAIEQKYIKVMHIHIPNYVLTIILCNH